MKFSTSNPEPLQVIFLDITDLENPPVFLKNAVFSFTPIFNVGDKISFQKAKIQQEIVVNSRGENQTHTVMSIYWAFSDFEIDEEESRTMAYMIVNLKKIG